MLEVGAVSGRALGLGMLVTAFVFGVRHGIDWDHLAAITDLTGAQPSSRRSMFLATCYALGHAIVVFALGVAAIVFAEELPDGVDTVMERVVGATLLLLGAYVVVSLVRHGRDFRMRSRWMLVIAAGRRVVASIRRRVGRATPQQFVVIEHDHPHRHDVDHGHAHLATPVGPHAQESHRAASERRASSAAPTPVHRHRHRHVLPVPPDPFAGPGAVGALGIGALHGIGAETPTQVVVFAGAAGATGPVAGVCVLVSFLVGLLVSNTAVAAAATCCRLTSARRFPLYAALSVVTALFSLVMGGLFLAGRGGALPSILGG
jgi:high-affinity nickel-transport protein